MPPLPLLLILLAIGLRSPAEGPSAADRIVLQDGSAVLGQLVSMTPSRIDVIVRRGWASAHLPDLAERWERTEAMRSDRARDDRLRRLRRWRDDLRAAESPGPIDDRINQAIARLEDPIGDDFSLLMTVGLDHREVARVEEASEDRRRMLRQGWRAGFDEVESMPVERLRDGLESRGFALNGLDPASIDDLLPIPEETDRRWLARRAATEVLDDPGLRLIRFEGLVLPDSVAGGVGVDRVDPAMLGGVIGGLLGGGGSSDPMMPHLQRIEADGRVGAVVTALEIAPDYGRVAVEAALLVRTGPGRWEVAARRRAEADPAAVPALDARRLADDPQVQAAFGLLEGLGIGAAGEDARRLSLGVGAAAEAALNRARADLEADLRSASVERLGARSPEPR